MPPRLTFLYYCHAMTALLFSMRIQRALSSSSSTCSFIAASRSSSLLLRPSSSSTTLRHSSDSAADLLSSGVSRLATLQSLLSSRGAPGSRGCRVPNGDLRPLDIDVAHPPPGEYDDLHPRLLPLARGASTGNLICALRGAHADDADYDSISRSSPWPVVESAAGMPGMRLLSLNSEHYMRRIVADANDRLPSEESKTLIDLYNTGLGEGRLSNNNAALDNVYVPGSVEDLGYGIDRYVLLRVGPFPDLYETMALNHLQRGDVESSLIAAEANNGKFGGFGSTFAFYARLLSSLPQIRTDEARDAARMCVRMPLPSMGLTRSDFADVSKLAQFADEGDSNDEAVGKMLEFYEKIREHERDENGGDKTPKQTASDEANYLLDVACLTGQKYGEVRERIAEIYSGAGMDDMASFVAR